jgi:hypothetical protein
MPQKHKDTKVHERIESYGRNLVQFDVLVILWQ